MELSCIIIDDEPLAIKLLEKHAAQIPFLRVEASFDNPVDAIAFLTAHPVNVIFLDIQMPQLSGLDMAKVVDSETRIIFTTAFEQYAYKSYEINALDYLLKPVDFEQFLKAANKALQWFSLLNRNAPNDVPPPGSLFVKSDHKLVRIDLARIEYVAGLKDYVRIFLEGETRSVISLMTMKAAEELLPSPQFVRIHRSYIVAVDKIKAIEQGNRVVVGKEYLPISDAYKEKFFAIITQASSGKK